MRSRAFDDAQSLGSLNGLNEDVCGWRQVRFRDIMKGIYTAKKEMPDLAANAFFSLTQAEYAAGNFAHRVLDNNQVRLSCPGKTPEAHQIV